MRAAAVLLLICSAGLSGPRSDRDLALRQADIEQVAGIGGAHLAGFAGAIDGERIETEIVEPEIALNGNPHLFSAVFPMLGLREIILPGISSTQVHPVTGRKRRAH